MSLREAEAIQMVAALDDYEHVCAAVIGGGEPNSYWLVVRDHRFGCGHEIASHCDYCDFIGALVDHRQCLSLTPLGGGVIAFSADLPRPERFAPGS